MLKYFSYKFDDGPLSSSKELLSEWKTGNCRRAVQYYIYNKKKIFLKSEQVLCPDSYFETGFFVINRDCEFTFDVLADGDIIYAEKICNKEGKLVDKSSMSFVNNDDYIISLHTALYTGRKGKEIYHATAIEGSSCYWSLEKFFCFYKPIAAKRV